jgi:hypothetical protein
MRRGKGRGIYKVDELRAVRDVANWVSLSNIDLHDEGRLEGWESRELCGHLGL